MPRKRRTKGPIEKRTFKPARPKKPAVRPPGKGKRMLIDRNGIGIPLPGPGPATAPRAGGKPKPGRKGLIPRKRGGSRIPEGPWGDPGSRKGRAKPAKKRVARPKRKVRKRRA